MTNRTIQMNDTLYQYLLNTSSRESPLLAQLRDETAKDPMARMQIGHEQGQFMGLLSKLMGARNIIEVGTFTGYSSICMAQNIIRPGSVICCDVSKEWTDIAQKYWREAGVADVCELHLAPALDTLREKPAVLIWRLSMPIKKIMMVIMKPVCACCAPAVCCS